MRAFVTSGMVALLSGVAFAQTFDAAAIKPSQHVVGKDAHGSVSFGPASLSGQNVTLMSLIIEAYRLQPHQVIGPTWLDSNEYDVEAKADGRASQEQLRLMLRTLLADRFRLTFHRETKELQTYELMADKKGPNVRYAPEGMSMAQLANLISIQLTIPAASDNPGKPSFAKGPLVPVLDKTGLEGTYDIRVELKLEPGVETFTLWQRFLADRLGLKLESRKSKVEILVVESAEKTPTSN